jgi:hypothetical protein
MYTMELHVARFAVSRLTVHGIDDKGFSSAELCLASVLHIAIAVCSKGVLL